MSQLAAVARAVAATPGRRAFAFVGSIVTILGLAAAPSLTGGSLLIIVIYGGSIVLVGARRSGPGEGARITYASTVPWVRLFFLLCLWEILNWFNVPFGTWKTLSDLSDPALTTWLGRALGATVWVWCGLWLLAADAERDPLDEAGWEEFDRGPELPGFEGGTAGGPR